MTFSAIVIAYHNGSALDSAGSPNKGQITHLVKNKKYVKSHPTQRSATIALVKFISTGLLPLSVVENNGFIELAQILVPQFQMPTRKHLSDTLLPHQLSN